MAKTRDRAPARGLRDALAALLASQHLAVLATHRGGQPYCSLVGFAASPDLKGLAFATTRATRKFENCVADPRVAMMIDSSTNDDSDFHKAIAVTALGEVGEVEKTARSRYLRWYLSKHPHLVDFVMSPSCALLRIRVRKYVIVRRFQEVSELEPR